LTQYTTGDQDAHPEGSPNGDRIEMRRYSPGDPLRLVLWKIYARTGQLLVRMPERAFTPSVRAMTFFVAGKGDEPSANLLRTILEKRLLGPNFLFGADGAAALTSSVPEALDQLLHSVNHRAMGGAGLDQMLDQAEAQGSAACVLFVPSKPGPWLDRVAATVARHRGPFATIIGVDSLQDDSQSILWRRLFLRADRVDGCHKSEVTSVTEVLAASGIQVQVIDRIGQHI